MQIAAPYTYESRFVDLPDEYTIVYSDTSTLEKLIDFCELYPDKRINIWFKDDKYIDLKILKTINKIHSNIAAKINYGTTNHLIDEFHHNKIQFFFDTSCNSFSMLDAMTIYKVSDIYLGDILFYHMAAVRNVCNQNNIRIRMVLNRINSLSPMRGLSPREPIFSPRDFNVLDEYIDIGEFDCGEPYNWEAFEVYRDSWLIKHDWFGDLREINEDLKFPIPNRYRIPNIADRKVNCGRKCSIGYKCTACEDLLQIIYNLRDNETWIKMEEDIDEEGIDLSENRIDDILEAWREIDTITEGKNEE